MQTSKNLSALLSDLNSTQEAIDNATNLYYEEMNILANDERTEQSMCHLSALFSLENAERGVLAASVCNSIVSAGYAPTYIIDDYISFFESAMKSAMPFIMACESKISEQEGSDDFDEDECIETMRTLLQGEYKESIATLTTLNEYFPLGITIFTSEQAGFEKGKMALEKYMPYHKYSTELGWLSILFKTLFDEPIVVIDIDKNIGFEGKITGVIDNYQLQALLMGNEILNTTPMTKEFLDIFDGTSEAFYSDNSVEGKWNMYNYQHLKYKLDKNDDKYWIWNEGCPADITVFKNRRVILLDEPSYTRTFNVARTFPYFSADLVIEKVLTAEDIKDWFQKINE